MVDARALPVPGVAHHTAVSRSDTRDLPKERSNRGRRAFKVALTLTRLNVFSRFLCHVGLEERMQGDVGRKTVMAAERVTVLEERCGSPLLCREAAGTSSQEAVTAGQDNAGSSFGRVQECSVRATNFFRLVLDSLSSVIFFFNYFLKISTEASAFLIPWYHISADPKLINEQQRNSTQNNSSSMSCTEVYFT